MRFEYVILRKLFDDPSSRERLKHLEQFGFQEDILKFIYRSIFVSKLRNVPISPEFYLNFVESKRLKEKTHGKVIEVIGSIFALKSPLESEVEYAIKGLKYEAETRAFCRQLETAAKEVSFGNLESAKRVLYEGKEQLLAYSDSDSRRKSARSMAELRPKTLEGSYSTGFRIIDQIVGGGQRTELWLVAGYVGELKSTFLISIAHNLFLKGKKVLFVSLEMSMDEVKQRLIGQHIAYMGKMVPSSEISSQLFLGINEQYYREAVVDFDSNPVYGDIEIYQPELGASIIDVGRQIETGSRILDAVIIDYAQLLTPLSKSLEHRHSLNDTLRYAKKMALEAYGRKGVFIVSGHQTSSDGRHRAEEKGFYDLAALSESIGAAQIANVVIWSLFTEEMRRRNEIKIGLSKSRNTTTNGSIHFLPVDLSFGLIGKEPIVKSANTVSSDSLDDLISDYS
jgi:replicative DNA helicase